MNKEQKFYSLLQDLFVGAKLEGDSGYVNLMNIKTDYFNKIRDKIKKEVKNKFGSDSPEDLYAKLYTFFDSYFSDGGSIFFSSTPDYKNIYTKVYNPREDVSLFWKTSRLYYVKSEANYRTIERMQIPNEPELEFDFHFDTSLLKLKQSNEKKELEFYFTGVKKRDGKKVIRLHVVYKDDNAIKKLKEVLKKEDIKELTKYVLEKSEKFKGKLAFKSEGLDIKKMNEKGGREFAKTELLIQENKDLLDGLMIYAAITDPVEIEKYLSFKGIALSVEIIERAYKIYKKQTEIDYFIHKDAKGFLREQFDLYAYEHILGQSGIDTIYDQRALDTEKKIKEIAYLVIDYIGNFEDELKKIWLKPKFARKSNYVVTFDRLAEKEGGIEVIKKIFKHEGIKEQISEWQELGIVEKKFNQKNIIKDGKLNKDWEKLPIDTKYFKDVELEIIGLFDNLDEELDGRLIKSDNFQALNTLLPKFKKRIQSVFIDPPFNKADSDQFPYIADYLDSSWITMLENRLSLSRDILSDTGTIFVNSDDKCNSYTRFLLDQVFNNFQNEIIWAYEKPGEGAGKFKNNHANIYFYSKFSKFLFNTLYVPRKGETELTKREGRHEVDYAGKISPDWWVDMWTEIPSFATAMTAGERIVKMLGIQFPTQIPEKLLYRVIYTGTNKLDYVMDYYGGTGVTAAVAQKMGRKWLSVELGNQFNTIIVPRMKIVLAYDKSGISKDINEYNGGGFFKYYELEQYEDALKKAVYNPADDELENIDFSLSEKQAKVALDIDFEKEKVRFVFDKLYPDIDIPETISNLFGKKIKKIAKDKVVFADDSEVDLNNLDFKKYEPLKKLIYW